MLVVTHIIAFLIGIYLGTELLLFTIKRANKKSQDKIETIFVSILNNIKSIKFSQRVHHYVQFKVEKYLLVYILDKKELAIFDGESCIANSTQIDKQISDKLIKYLDSNFKKEINDDLIDVGGYFVSQSYIDEVNKSFTEMDLSDENYEEELNLDDILDKINNSGINSLTEKELEFLNNWGK